jgi:hypothetical protein
VKIRVAVEVLLGPVRAITEKTREGTAEEGKWKKGEIDGFTS